MKSLIVIVRDPFRIVGKRGEDSFEIVKFTYLVWIVRCFCSSIYSFALARYCSEVNMVYLPMRVANLVGRRVRKLCTIAHL